MKNQIKTMLKGAFKEILAAPRPTAPLPAGESGNDNHRSRRARIKFLLKNEKNGVLNEWRKLIHMKKHRSKQYAEYLSESITFGRQFFEIKRQETLTSLNEQEDRRDASIAGGLIEKFGEQRAEELIKRNQEVDFRRRKKTNA